MPVGKCLSALSASTIKTTLLRRGYSFSLFFFIFRPLPSGQKKPLTSLTDWQNRIILNYQNKLIDRRKQEMNDNWWVIGETVHARLEEIRSLFARTYLRPKPRRRSSRCSWNSSQPATRVGAAVWAAAPCC